MQRTPSGNDLHMPTRFSEAYLAFMYFTIGIRDRVSPRFQSFAKTSCVRSEAASKLFKREN